MVVASVERAGVGDAVVQRAARDQRAGRGTAARPPRPRPSTGTTLRVRDLLGGGDLAPEAADEHLVLRELGRDDLDGHGLAAVLDALEDDAHPAAPDDPGDPVGTDGIARPGLEGDLRHSSAPSISARPVGQDRPDFRLAVTLRGPPTERDTGPDLAMDRPMLGDYRIEGIVGVGRMGVVYLAIDRDHGRAVRVEGAARRRQHRPRLPRALPARGRAARGAPSTRTSSRSTAWAS